MKTIARFLSKAFRLLVLKPFDFILFGGSGVLSIPREEWREIINASVQAAGRRTQFSNFSASCHYDDDDEPWMCGLRRADAPLEDMYLIMDFDQTRDYPLDYPLNYLLNYSLDYLSHPR